MGTMDMTKNVAEAITALTEKPVLSTSAERVFILDGIKSEKKDLPQPLRFAFTMQKLLERVSVPVEPHDLIAGRALDRLLTNEEEKRFKEYNDSPDNPNKIVLFDSGHGCYDWQAALDLGLGGLIAKAEERKKTATPDQTVANLLGSYFNRGGLHAQFSSANVEDLEDAMRDPASHRDLRVRVTGYSGVFVDICERLQKDIIGRMKNE